MSPSVPPAGARPPERFRPPSTSHPRRRRRAALGVLAAIALVAAFVGLAVGVGSRPETGERSDAGRPDAPRSRVAGLSLEQRVGQTLLLSFRGTEAPEYVLDILRERRAAGVVLFRENAASPRQLRSLTRRLQRAAGGSALVAADQEGGSIRILSWAGPVNGQATLQTDAQAAEAAGAAARDLAAAGVNVNLAPVADVGAPGGSAVGGRAYPGDAEQVASRTRAAVRALAESGVAATPKHFPGFGAAQANTDDEPVTIDAPRAKLLDTDLVPFRAAAAAGAPLVMVSHALYPALDRRRIASQSSVVIDEVLRRRTGFRGVAITDSIEAEAVLSRSSVDVAAERSLAAGVDIVLMTGPGSYAPVRDRVVGRARRSEAFRRRIDAAAERVLVLKERLDAGRGGAASGRR